MIIYDEVVGGLKYQFDGETLYVLPWGDAGFRIVSTPFGNLELETNNIERPPITKKISYTIKQDYSIIENELCKVQIDERGWNSQGVITFFNKQDEVLLQEQDGGGALLRKPRFFKNRGTSSELTVSFIGDKSEKIFGMGQYQQDILNLNGCTLELAHRNSQASVPVYVSSKGYGFIWNNPAIGKVSFSSNVYEWSALSAKNVDYVVVVGATPKEITERLTEITGRAPMFPEFGLGFWQCKLRYKSEQEVLQVAKKYHELKIPVDMFIIDYYHWPRCGDYRFDKYYFSEPAKMVEQLKEYGMETMVSIWPQIDTRSENYDEMKEQGLLVKSLNGLDIQMIFHGNNVFYDATNPNARKYVWEKCYQNYFKLGIHNFWLDEAEPEFGTYDFSNYRYHQGAVLEVGNIYPVDYAKGFYEGQIQAKYNTPINLIRCAWLGSQKYAALVWSGDIHSTFEDFKNQIVCGIQMGLAGITWWTTDIGGFHGGDINNLDFQNLLIRWFQFGTFCPVMRLHGSRSPFTNVYNYDGEETERTGADNEIWSYGEKNYEIMKKFIQIREILKPYTAKTALEAHQKGTPFIRAMFYEFPHDECCYNLNTQYMFGAEILVAPIVELNATGREVYLPAGANWTDARTGIVYEGGKQIYAQASIETVPIYLRDEAVQEIVGKL